MLSIIRLLRPKQWIKNAFVFAPFIFAKVAHELPSDNVLSFSLIATAIFCLISSTVYVFNDLMDVEKDKLHPSKKLKRPIAAGLVTMNQAKILLILLILGTTVSLYFFQRLLIPAAIYLGISVAYSIKLKHVPVIDLFSIASGFVIRVYAGAVAIQVPLSIWMFITTLCLALYLASIKRYQEVSLQGSGSRQVLKNYSTDLLSKYALFSSICSAIFYSLFILSERQTLAPTIPVVILGLFRYQYLVDVKKEGESPTDTLWSDWGLMVTILSWVLTLYVCSIR